MEGGDDEGQRGPVCREDALATSDEGGVSSRLEDVPARCGSRWRRDGAHQMAQMPDGGDGTKSERANALSRWQNDVPARRGGVPATLTGGKSYAELPEGQALLAEACPSRTR